MSGTKRKVEELGGHVLSAAVGDVVARTMSAAVARYEARASMDDQLERLGTLAIMVHSAVEAAEGVHIRSWWLRRWLWRLRDAALDADEVLRLFRHKQRADEDEETGDAATRQTAGNDTVWSWSAAWRALRSVKGILFGRDDDGKGIERLSRMVAKLEREAMGLGDFLKVLDLEVRRSLAVQPAAPPVPSSEPPAAIRGVLDHACIMMRRPKKASAPAAGDLSRFDHGLSSISHEEYVAGMRKMGLVIVRQHIRRTLDWLMVMVRRKPPAAPPASRAHAPPAPDTDRLRELVARIQRAVHATSGSATLDFQRKRSWLCRWRYQLQSMATIAKYQLRLAVSVQKAGTGGGGDGGDGAVSEGMRRPAAQDMETAAAHLEDFVTLTRFALASLGRPCITASPSTYTSEQRELLFQKRV